MNLDKAILIATTAHQRQVDKHTKFIGYDKDEEGNLIINEKQSNKNSSNIKKYQYKLIIYSLYWYNIDIPIDKGEG